ncbi:nuclease [Xylaria bambusicola]|uniref:nuclease n=1 Tax=Xylaria bambusicola TaxID=326684 RepID=UPI0020074940|nr:nuclease [Xylaria bambusicola]KAI0521500.1 nuclease [Xylaria bambusicola]
MLTSSQAICTMSKFADLRIASARAYYNNNKPYGEAETITLYIYNAGPDRAAAPVVRAGYTYSMDYNNVTTSLRSVKEWGQPSQDIRSGSLIWTDLPHPTSHYEGWDMVTTLPDIEAGRLMELKLSFPMLHETSHADYTLNASVSSSTIDPRTKNNSTTYIITPNHNGDDEKYWKTPGDLANLDFDGLTSVVPLSQADLRIASAYAHYNNNLPYGQSETLTFFVFNHGPTIATKPLVTAGYGSSMDWTNISCSGEQLWVPDGIDPSLNIDSSEWQPLDGVSCHYEGWNVICSLPNIPPTVLYRVKITFPMTHKTSSEDVYATARISSDAAEVNPDNKSTSYVITPNHNDDDDEYWQAKGTIEQLNGPSEPSGARACSTGWLLDTPIILDGGDGIEEIALRDLETVISNPDSKNELIMSLNLRNDYFKSKAATKVGYKTSTDVIVLSFSADGKNELSFKAHPDTLLYLIPSEVKVGETKLRLGYWMPVQTLWVGAVVKGMSPGGGSTVAYITNIKKVRGTGFRSAENAESAESAEPQMVSKSHSYVVGRTDFGGVLTHNPKTGEHCGNPNVPAILQYLVFIAFGLIATLIPPPNLLDPPHGYSLRHRRPSDPRPPPQPAPPVLPLGVPRRDGYGNWLIYLYEEDTPGAVENARYAVEQVGLPWQLTYDPAGAPARRSQSTGRHPSQRELLQLATEELGGATGTTGQLDRDEYPPAIALEGGSGAIVTYIEAGDNRRAGSLMGQQFANYRMVPQPDNHSPLQPGDTFRYVIIHANMAGLDYLGDGTDESQIEEPPID